MVRERIPKIAYWARTAPRMLPWSPVIIGFLYVIVFIGRFPKLIERVYWDSDAATAAVVAETYHGGTVVLQRFGWFTSLWFALLTRALPFHREIWEVAPYLFSLFSVALIALAGWHLSGRWAAFVSATAAVATSPFVSYDLVTLNYHTGTWVPVVILAAYCLWIARWRSVRQLALTAAIMSVLSGTTLASDHLFAFVGLIPFAVTGLVLITYPTTRRSGVAVLVSVLGVIPIWQATNLVMTAADIRVLPAPIRFATDTLIWPNFGRLVKQIIQLDNGDYFFNTVVGVRSTLSLACAGLILVAIAIPYMVVRREFKSAQTSVPKLVWATFWATCVTFDGASFVLSSEGAHGGYYVIPILYAAAATVPLALSQTFFKRVIVGLGVSIIATTSLINLIDENTELIGGLPTLASFANQIGEIAKSERTPYGYADYWDATSLAWSQHMDIQVQPVSKCQPPLADGLCAYPFNSTARWYKSHPSRSFVLRDTSSSGMSGPPPNSLGPPIKTYPLSSTFTMYIYPYDVASRLDFSYATWNQS